MFKKIVLTIILLLALEMALTGVIILSATGNPLAFIVCFGIALLMTYGVITAI